MMRILHVGKFYPPYFGGIEKVNYDLVEGLNDRKVNVDILCSSHNKGQTQVINDKYKIYRIRTLGVLASTPISLGFVTILKKIQDNYDIIHVHLPNPLANLALFLSRPKAKIILHWHSDIIKQKFLLKLYSPLQRWLLRRADKIVVTSPNYMQSSEVLQKYTKKIVCIPLGIDKRDLFTDEDFTKKIRDKYRRRKIIFSLGRLIYYKGFKYLIEAAKNLPDSIVILIGGVGNMKEKLQKMIMENNLQDKVFLLGSIPHNFLGSYYSVCDIFCLPSIEKSEAFGVVQIEAMSFKKPIISTDISGSGVPWVNKNNVSGIVVPVKNSLALSKGILALLEDADRYNDMAEGAFKRYKQLFTKEKMINNFLNLYEEILRN